MSEDTEIQTPNEPPRLIANYKPIKVPAQMVLVYFYRSMTKIEAIFKVWISEYEFNYLKAEFDPLTRKVEISGDDLNAFLNPVEVSSQIILALDAKIKSWFKRLQSDKIVYYRFNGETKTIFLKFTDKDGGIKGELEITNTASNENGLIFDAITYEDAKEGGDDILGKVGEICLMKGAARDATNFLERVKTAEIQRRAQQG